jgi:formylmethanofuran dehydrogenase subunit E
MTALLLALLSAAPTGVPAKTDPIAASRFIHGAPAHGVPGPWVLSGYRVGAHALKRLGLTREQAFELEVVHRAVPEVRYACMADGLMASTGASPGKLNLSMENVDTEDELETIVTHKKTGLQLVYRLKKELRDRIRETDYADFPRAAKMLAALKDDALFTVEERPPAQPAVATDPCADFNAQQKNRLSDEEHMKQFGCPPCPCACVNGRVTCAPCAACAGFGGGRPDANPLKKKP